MFLNALLVLVSCVLLLPVIVVEVLVSDGDLVSIVTFPVTLSRLGSGEERGEGTTPA